MFSCTGKTFAVSRKNAEILCQTSLRFCSSGLALRSELKILDSKRLFTVVLFTVVCRPPKMLLLSGEQYSYLKNLSYPQQVGESMTKTRTRANHVAD